MKANELMIGDIVSVNNTPLKIAALGTQKAGFIDAKGEMFYHAYENLKPIPLTDEILEKNGFVNGILRVFATPFLRQRVWSKVEVYEYKPFRVGKQLNAYRLMIGGKESSGVDIHINHVHELQHTLKLCGIKKEIEL